MPIHRKGIRSERFSLSLPHSRDCSGKDNTQNRAIEFRTSIANWHIIPRTTQTKTMNGIATITTRSQRPFPKYLAETPPKRKRQKKVGIGLTETRSRQRRNHISTTFGQTCYRKEYDYYMSNFAASTTSCRHTLWARFLTPARTLMTVMPSSIQRWLLYLLLTQKNCYTTTWNIPHRNTPRRK